MIKLQTATVLSDLLLENAKIYMAQVGSLFPYFLLMKSGSPMFIEADTEEIINVQNDSEPEIDDVYRSVVYLRMDRDEDVMSVQPIAKYLVEAHNPDAIAFVVPSYYKVTNNPAPDDIYSLDKDPESIKILYNTLYVTEDPIGYLKVVPYQELGDELNEDRIEKGLKYRFNFTDYNWTLCDSQMRGRFDNPFSKEAE